MNWTWQPPRDLLGRVRLGFMVAVLVSAVTGIALILAATNIALEVRSLGMALVVALCGSWIRSHQCKSFGPISTAITAGAFVVIGLAMSDPIRSCELIYVALLHQALFRSRRSLSWATALYLLALATSTGLAVYLVPGNDVTFFEVVVHVPVVLLIGVIHIMGVTIGRHERAALRERALAATGSALVAASSHADIHAAALSGAHALVAPHGTASVSLAIGTTDEMRVVAIDSPHETPEMHGFSFDLTRLPEIQKTLAARRAFELGRDVVTSVLNSVGLPQRHGPMTVFVSPLVARDDLRGAITVATSQSLPDECKDALTTLSTEVALALETADLHERLSHQAQHDPLTELANRRLLAEHGRQALEQATRSGSAPALLVMDMDGFKKVNDSLGHAAGDQMLVEIAERLKGCVPPGHVIARLGGDEFAVLLKDASASDVRVVAEHILQTLRRPIALSGALIVPEASMGLVLDARGASIDAVLADADLAMYAAKRSGKGRYVVFEPRLREQAVRQLELEVDLRRALERGEFELHYQPIVRLASGELIGVEALVRWRHTERGLLGPAAFIPQAEETGLIERLGEWVLRAAVRQARQWQLQYPGQIAVRVGVNLSPRQLQQPDLVETIRDVLAEASVGPEALTLELTESSLVSRTDDILARLQAIRALGVKLALDDFGTGYSSLAYLSDFPFDVLKVDRSFVNSVVGNSQKAGLVRAIVELAHTLEMRTVAEGIETAEQAALLRGLRCDYGQGYYFARPTTADLIEGWLGQADRAA